MRFDILACAALICAITGPATAQIFKCTDKDGRVIYSQTRPANGTCADANVSAPASSGANGGGLMDYSKSIDKSRAAEAGDQKKLDAARQQQGRICSQARAQLALLQQTGAVFTVDEKGERHYDSDAQRQARIDAVRQAVAANCQN